MNLTSEKTFLEEIDKSLRGGDGAAEKWELVLEKVIRFYGAAVGTLHRLDEGTHLLELVAHQGIPPSIMNRVLKIPVGKGMAGLAAQRQAPVQICNLQTDASGVAKPGAKETKVEGSMAAPILVDGRLKGTIGVGKSVPYEFNQDEEEFLMAIGRTIGGHFGREPSTH